MSVFIKNYWVMCQPEFARAVMSSMILVHIPLIFHHMCAAVFTLVLHQPLIFSGHFYIWVYQHYNYSHMHSGREEWKALRRPGFKLGGVNGRMDSTIRGPEPCKFSIWPIITMVQCHVPILSSSKELFVPFTYLPSPLSCLSCIDHCDDQEGLHKTNSDIYIIAKTKTIALGSWTLKLNWFFLIMLYQARGSMRI